MFVVIALLESTAMREGEEKCKQCPAGMYNKEVGQSVCSGCALGQYGISTNECAPCEVETYADELGLKEWSSAHATDATLNWAENLPLSCNAK